jgi:hypothetical protein
MQTTLFFLVCISVAVGMRSPSRSLEAAIYSCLLRLWCLPMDIVLFLFHCSYLETNIVSQLFTSKGCLSGSSSFFEQICHSINDFSSYIAKLLLLFIIILNFLQFLTCLYFFYIEYYIWSRNTVCIYCTV